MLNFINQNYTLKVLINICYCRTWKERLIVKCIKNNIAVFSPHTSWDAVQGGVNDWLARSLPITSMSVLKPSENDVNVGAGRLTNLPHPIKISDAVTKIKEHIGISHVRLALAVGKNEGTFFIKCIFVWRNNIIILF